MRDLAETLYTLHNRRSGVDPFIAITNKDKDYWRALVAAMDPASFEWLKRVAAR